MAQNRHPQLSQNRVLFRAEDALFVANRMPDHESMS